MAPLSSSIRCAAALRQRWPADRRRAAGFEYALIDVRLPGGSGIELVRALRAVDEGTRLVVFTEYGTIANAVEAMRAGAFD